MAAGVGVSLDGAVAEAVEGAAVPGAVALAGTAVADAVAVGGGTVAVGVAGGAVGVGVAAGAHAPTSSAATSKGQSDLEIDRIISTNDSPE